MFGEKAPTGLAAGEIREEDQADWLFQDGFDDLLHRLSKTAMTERPFPAHRLPTGFDLIPVGPILGAAISRLDRKELNGYDMVRTLQAEERMISHYQARSIADMVEISYSASGDADSPAARLDDAFEYAADEIRAALTLTRRAAEGRMALATDIRERLPRVWHALDDGSIDMSRACVIVRGVAHLSEAEAREVADTVLDKASRLTTGQLAAWIRRRCVDNDPEQARKRYENALADRKLWIEQTVDGTGNLHLLDIPIEDAKAIGRRVNGHMISLQKTGNESTHDQLRADIATDMLLGADPTLGGRGLVEIRVDMTTLAHLDDKSAEIPGMGPVIADVARKVADRQHQAEWRAVVTDDEGQVVEIVTTSRRPTRASAGTLNQPNRPARSPGAGSRRPKPIGTTSNPNPTVARPRPATVAPNAGTITSSKIKAGATDLFGGMRSGSARSVIVTRPSDRPDPRAIPPSYLSNPNRSSS